jgi:hypothetical protein
MIQFGKEGNQVEVGSLWAGMEFPSALSPIGLRFLFHFERICKGEVPLGSGARDPATIQFEQQDYGERFNHIQRSMFKQVAQSHEETAISEANRVVDPHKRIDLNVNRRLRIEVCDLFQNILKFSTRLLHKFQTGFLEQRKLRHRLILLLFYLLGVF